MGKKMSASVFAACAYSLAAVSAQASMLASDHFQVGTGYYNAGALSSQGNTFGTSGYSGNWLQNTSAVVVESGGLTHSRMTNASPTPEGRAVATGNANPRSQNRNFASLPSLPDYYFSALIQSSATFASGKAFIGIGPATSGTDSPAGGAYVGFTSAGITLFYKGAAGMTTKTLLASYTPGSTYLANVHINKVGSTANIDTLLYDASGTLVNSSSATGTIILAEMAALDMSVSNNFNGGSPSKIIFDEFRFGTSQADVAIVPEPVMVSLAGVGLGAMLLRRRGR